MSKDISLVDLLIVEDNQYDLEIILRSLEKSNINKKIHVVKDGEEAIDFLFAKGVYSDRIESNIPKVIFLDLNLPKISGIEVLTEIRATPIRRNPQN